MCPRQTLKKLSASFCFFFPGTRVFYLKPLLWRDFFYSIIASCLIEFLASRSLTLSIYVTRWRLSVHLLGFAIFTASHPLFTRSKQDCIGLLSLSPVTAGEGGIRIPSHREGEEVQCSLYRLRRGRQPTAGYAVPFHPAPMREGHRPLLP